MYVCVTSDQIPGAHPAGSQGEVSGHVPRFPRSLPVCRRSEDERLHDDAERGDAGAELADQGVRAQNRAHLQHVPAVSTHSVLTQYQFNTHSVTFTPQCTHTHMHTEPYSSPTWRCGQYSLSTHSVLTQYPLSTHSVLTQYPLSTHSVLTQYSVRTQYSFNTNSTLTQYSFSTHSVLSTHSILIQYSFSTNLYNRRQCPL